VVYELNINGIPSFSAEFINISHWRNPSQLKGVQISVTKCQLTHQVMRGVGCSNSPVLRMLHCNFPGCQFKSDSFLYLLCDFHYKNQNLWIGLSIFDETLKLNKKPDYLLSVQIWFMPVFVMRLLRESPFHHIS